jgi:hypothetical protein
MAIAVIAAAAAALLQWPTLALVHGSESGASARRR